MLEFWLSKRGSDLTQNRGTLAGCLTGWLIAPGLRIRSEMGSLAHLALMDPKVAETLGKSDRSSQRLIAAFGARLAILLSNIA